MRRVTVVRTGTANLASMVAALERCGARAEVTSDPGVAAAADRLVLPGVGSFGAVARSLHVSGLADALVHRLGDGRPFLAVCLGLQLLAAASEEDPGVPGLGFIDAEVTRFAPGSRVPQLGWNRITAGRGCRLLSDGVAYFANSYKLDRVPAGWAGATAEHGESFVAALERGPVLACQFHPELSGAWGQALLESWLEVG